MFMRYLRLSVRTLISAAALLGLTMAVANAAEPIKIGSFLAVTGPASFLGAPEKKTLELYIAKINAAGGILGRKVEAIIYDDGGSAKKAVTFVKRLIEQDKVDFLIGGSTTGATMAVVPIVTRAKIPLISLAGASIIIDPVKKWIFKIPHTDAMAVGKVYTDMRKRGIGNVGLIAGSGGFDRSCIKNAKKLAPKYGIKIVAAETYGKGDTDMTPQLTKIKDAPGLQSVLFCGFGSPAVIVTKNYRQLGIKVPFYHTHGSASMKFVQGAGAAANGIRLPAAALLVAAQLPGTDPQRAVGMRYTKAYKAKYGEDVSTFGGSVYDALYLMKGAMERAKSTNKAKVRNALEQTKGFVGVGGIFTMSPTDHLGLDLASFKMLEIENGHWVLLY